MAIQFIIAFNAKRFSPAISLGPKLLQPNSHTDRHRIIVMHPGRSNLNLRQPPATRELHANVMSTLFWLSCALVTYAYIGYAMLLWAHAAMGTRHILRQPATPTISILIAARNEAATLPAKLENLRALDYPHHLTQTIIVSDGSTDATAAILGRAIPQIQPILLSESGGKARALNTAVQHATGDILIFLDTRQSLDPNAVSELISCFADPHIGAISGELILESANDSANAGEALGLYWKIEKSIRRLESATGSVVGVTGAIYAMRRELYVPIPPGTILDDVLIPMHVARTGHRVIFAPAAIARDRIFTAPGKEFARKVRTLTGNYQLLRLAPWLLTPANPLLFRFISHKLMRLVVPLFLFTMLLSSALASTPLYSFLFWLQIVFYTAAAIGMLLPPTRKLKPIAIASTFVMLNAAAVLAFYNFARGRHEVWR
jgi:biofilm PGA synthesis N-glycosyltransferase PgaC